MPQAISNNSVLLFRTTPYCDANCGSCFKSSFNFDRAAYKPEMQIMGVTNTISTDHRRWQSKCYIFISYCKSTNESLQYETRTKLFVFSYFACDILALQKWDWI